MLIRLDNHLISSHLQKYSYSIRISTVLHFTNRAEEKITKIVKLEYKQNKTFLYHFIIMFFLRCVGENLYQLDQDIVVNHLLRSSQIGTLLKRCVRFVLNTTPYIKHYFDLGSA